ncbi:MAG: hypothetical protein ACYC61_22815 [Isosphaeraceae bacterium]
MNTSPSTRWRRARLRRSSLPAWPVAASSRRSGLAITVPPFLATQRTVRVVPDVDDFRAPVIVATSVDEAEVRRPRRGGLIVRRLSGRIVTYGLDASGLMGESLPTRRVEPTPEADTLLIFAGLALAGSIPHRTGRAGRSRPTIGRTRTAHVR